MAWLAKLPCDEIWEIEVRPYQASRSAAQNRRYWKLVGMAADHTGHDKDELHEMFKARYLGMNTATLAGESVTYQRSSARLKVKEFAEYMERCETFCVETLGVWLE